MTLLTVKLSRRNSSPKMRSGRPVASLPGARRIRGYVEKVVGPNSRTARDSVGQGSSSPRAVLGPRTTRSPAITRREERTMAIVAERPAAPSRPRSERLFRDQPRWFGTLFMVDVWERFSFYGMTAILYLYFVAPIAQGGLGLAAGDAAALFGTYMSLMFIAALPGGWLADRVLGARRSVLLGGSLIAAGHYTLSVPARPTLYLGLLLVIAGTGLVKPAIGTLISSPYPNDHARREAIVSIFYMSVQIAAFLAPIVTGFLGEKINWHLGF